MAPRRLGRLSAALLITSALLLTSSAPATAGASPKNPDHPAPGQFKRPGPGKKDKLGPHDRDLLSTAQRNGKKTVTAMIAVAPGQMDAARKAVEAAGGRVASSNDKVGYLRATLPVGAVDGVSQKSSVLAIDLDEEIKLGNPLPAREGKKTLSPKAPGATTPAANAYLPTNETGAVAFAAAHPQWDGRGITIGILDTGVDLDHPALATTTTGERKIVDWVTATDPLTEGDGTWLRMDSTVTATPTFQHWGQDYTAPASGTYAFGTFYESDTMGDNELNGDVNRDGDNWDSWGVLYRASDHAIWVDSDGDGLFTDEPLMHPFREAQQSGHFGVDDPTTAVHETVPFVVEYRTNVDLTPIGQPGEVADFVNIGLPAGAHATHVAGIAAGHSLFGGAMNGAAPGAKIVSSRACTWAGGCTAVALTEGMIDLVVNRGVDVVNMSIGGLPALNDGANARTYLYNALINLFGVQIFISAGNNGPGVNTIGDPSVATDAVSVGASVSSETWAVDYGSKVATRMGIFNFSSRGPREDGGFKPNVVAPGAAVSSIPMWLPGEPVAEAGYQLPAGYGMFNGTSMASPQAAGAAALLLSAAKATGVDASPAKLRSAIYDGAGFLPGVPAYQQGNGLLDVTKAWGLLHAGGLATSTYAIDAPVCTAISDYLVNPGRGEGIYDRCGGTPARLRDVTITRTAGPAGDVAHKISWIGGDGTFGGNPDSVALPLGVPVVIQVRVTPRGNGVHSAIMVIDNPATPGRDARMLATVVISDDLVEPGYTEVHNGEVAKGQAESYFVTVPEHAKTLQVRLDGVSAGSRVRFVGQHPYGVPMDTGCYTGMVTEGCDPGLRSYTDPMPGVWEITVEGARTSPTERNRFRLTASVFGATADAVVALGTVELHQPVDVSWDVTNHLGAVQLGASTSPLGSRRSERPNVGNGAQTSYRVTVPIGTTRFEARIGNPGDKAADLDLIVTLQGQVMGASADGDSDESVVIDNPPAGNYTIWIDGYSVPSGNTDFDYFDEIRTGTLGTVATTFAAPLGLAHGATATVTAKVTAHAMMPSGRQLYGVLDLVSTTGAIVGQAEVSITAVNGPSAHIGPIFGPMAATSARGGVVAGSAQIDGVGTPARWTEAGGLKPYSGYEGVIISLNNVGDGVGRSNHGASSVGAVFHADGTVTELPVPAWQPADQHLYSSATAINDGGVVVGTAVAFFEDPDGHFVWVNDPFLWTAAGGYVRLPHLTDDTSYTEPIAINSSGVIVGHSNKNNASTACWWDASGGIHEIGGVAGDTDSVLLSINDSGTAVGESGSRAAIWTPDGGMRRLPDFGYHSKALAINASGWVIGNADFAPYDQHVVAWDPQGNLYDLNTMLVEQDAFWMSEAVGVSDSGDFVVYGEALDGSGGTTAIIRL